MKQTVLVTGASSGIGLEIARVFAQNGFNLVLSARSKDKLDALAGELRTATASQVGVFTADLSQPGEARRLFEEVIAAGHQVDILINNAGVGLWGHFSETSLDKELAMLQLNITSLTELSKLFLRPMIQRGSGRICNIASTAAFQPGPLMAVYYASKTYVLHFTEALANELQGTGVTATAVCPGPTESDFVNKADLGPSKLFRRSLPTARSVAGQAYRAVMAGKPVHVCGLWNTVLVNLHRLTPRSFATAVVRRMQERVGN
ncbi:MAG: SDR family oxidoreductase [Acidobacteria bacterium]|nr:SDR family oxidoreductase [Acidobacteriota bacterium]